MNKDFEAFLYNWLLFAFIVIGCQAISKDSIIILLLQQSRVSTYVVLSFLSFVLFNLNWHWCDRVYLWNDIQILVAGIALHLGNLVVLGVGGNPHA